MRHLFCVENIDRCGSLAARDKNVQFWLQNLEIWGQKSIFFGGYLDFCQQGPGPQLSIQTTPKKILFPSYGSFFGLTSVFGHSPITTISYLNLTVFNKTWWKRPGQQKNESKWQRTQSRPDYGETAFFLAKNAFYPKKQPKMHFIPKNGQNFLRDWYLLPPKLQGRGLVFKRKWVQLLWSVIGDCVFWYAYR